MALSAIILNSVDEQIKMLNVSPQVLPRLQQLISDANTNPDEILDLIRMDQAMTARIIKTSNSAYFSPGFRVANIEDAVTYLGYDEVYRIISLLSVARMMRSPLRYFGLESGELWRRSLACALAMDGLSPLLDTNKRIGYTVGLLHGIGMVFVDRQLAANKAPVPVVMPAEADVRLLGVHHAEVGAYVLRQWNFPDELNEPLRCQFDPLTCLAYNKLACLLHIAKHIMQTVIRTWAEGEKAPEPDPLVLTMVNLSSDEYAEVLQEVEGKFTLLEIATVDL